MAAERLLELRGDHRRSGGHAPQLISVIHPENIASKRVAERLGMRRLRELTLDAQPVLIFGTERPEAT